MRHTHPFPAILRLLPLALLIGHARAQLYWDTSDTGGLQGGAGTWSTGEVNWNPAADGSGTRVVWSTSPARFDVNATVTASGSPQYSNLIVGSGATVSISGVTIMSSGGSFTVNAGGQATVTGSDALRLQASDGTYTLTNNSLNTLAISDIVRNSAGGNQNMVFGGSGTITVTNLKNTGTGTITKNDAGLTTIGSKSNQANIPVTVNGGTLSLGGTSHFTTRTTATALNLNGGTLRTTGDRPNGISNATHGITLGASGGGLEQTGSTTFTQNGVITGSGALTKSGTGTLQLNNSNDFAGNTTVSAGTLAFGSGGSVASSTITVGASGTLDTSAIANYILTPGKTILSAGVLTGSPTFTVNGGTFTQTTGSWTTDLFHITGSAGSVSVDDLAAAATGGKELRYTIDAGGVTPIVLTDNNPFGAYTGAAQWKERWEISVIGNLFFEDYPSSIVLMQSTAGYDLGLLAGTGLTINAKNNLNADTPYNHVANGQKIWLGGGAGQAQYTVNFSSTEFSLDLVVGSARAIPEPGTFGLLALGLALLRWKMRQGSVGR